MTVNTLKIRDDHMPLQFVADEDKFKLQPGSESSWLSSEAFGLVRDNAIAKGDVLRIAEVAGVMGGKQTGKLIPLCHPLPLDAIQVECVLDDALHAEALAAGVLRYCPICDAYEVTDKRVAVIGTGAHGTAEAVFLRGYTADLTLVSHDAEHALDAQCEAELEAAGIARVDGPCGGFAIEDGQLAFDTAAGRLRFDSVYPALGSRVRSELAAGAGAMTSADDCLVVDSHQRTNVPGLFAAGDVVKGLDQISHAMGEGGVAATTIRNYLAELAPIRR